MKINKDNIIGAIAMLLILAIIAWGIFITGTVQSTARAHNALVQLLQPVIQQLQQAEMYRTQAAQRAQAQPPQMQQAPQAQQLNPEQIKAAQEAAKKK